MDRFVSQSTLQRLPKYLGFLHSLPRDETLNISATTVANALGMGEVQVRKDLAAVCGGGKPKVGYSTSELTKALEEYLGYNDVDDAVIIGAGKLGRALLDYKGFNEYGVNIAAAFDSDSEVTGVTAEGKNIFPLSEFSAMCKNNKYNIGIIAVPAEQAQKVCDMMIQNGITAILNFAPTHLIIPQNVLLQNENLAASLAVLSRKLKEQIN